MTALMVPFLLVAVVETTVLSTSVVQVDRPGRTITVADTAASDGAVRTRRLTVAPSAAGALGRVRAGAAVVLTLRGSTVVGIDLSRPAPRVTPQAIPQLPPNATTPTNRQVPQLPAGVDPPQARPIPQVAPAARVTPSTGVSPVGVAPRPAVRPVGVAPRPPSAGGSGARGPRSARWRCGRRSRRGRRSRSSFRAVRPASSTAAAPDQPEMRLATAEMSRAGSTGLGMCSL